MQKRILKSSPHLTFAIAAALAWTLGTAVSYWWNLKSQDMAAVNTARAAARTAFEKDVVYRLWNSMHGGVYVPVSPRAEPNPFLEGFPARDIETTEGRRLTMLNPAYMNRQVHEIERSRTGARGHLTSLRPIRPGNAPDDWEREVLQKMVTGDEEYSGVQVMDGIEFMRYMRPLVMEEACLKCHEQHGYSLGQVRGGLSVSTPMGPFRQAVAASVRAVRFWHLFSWFVGMAGIVFSAHRLSSYYRKQVRSDQLIRESLEEKEILLREIHHRVKNNLQVISGMLELQAFLVKDPAAIKALRESRNRVMSMALVHQKLYQSEDMANVLMDAYLGGLVDDLSSAFGVTEKVLLRVEVQAVRLPLDTAIPLGLLVSELVTNSLKYAFPQDADVVRGEITVSFRELEDGSCFLSVADNGVGLPEGFDPDESASLGLKIVHSIVGQLGGQITLEEVAGTAWTIVCPPYYGAETVIESPAG